MHCTALLPKTYKPSNLFPSSRTSHSLWTPRYTCCSPHCRASSVREKPESNLRHKCRYAEEWAPPFGHEESIFHCRRDKRGIRSTSSHIWFCWDIPDFAPLPCLHKPSGFHSVGRSLSVSTFSGPFRPRLSCSWLLPQRATPCDVSLRNTFSASASPLGIPCSSWFSRRYLDFIGRQRGVFVNPFDGFAADFLSTQLSSVSDCELTTLLWLCSFSGPLYYKVIMIKKGLDDNETYRTAW